MMHFTPPKYNHVLLQAAAAHLGTKEIKGPLHNPEIVSWFRDSGHPEVKDDETPYCAAFIGSILAEIGLFGTGKLNARSYLDWGEDVSLKDVQAGDLVIFWRVSPSSWQGHIGVVVRFEGDKVICRGANQKNEVRDDPYDLEQVLGYRRAVDAPPAGLHTIREGASGPLVSFLQKRLKELGYNIGRADDGFDTLLTDAVILFQKDNNLVADGIVGSNTWVALKEAKPRVIERKITMKELRDLGSVGVKTGDRQQQGSVGFFGFNLVTEAAGALGEAEGFLGVLGGMDWQKIAIVGGVCLAAIWLAQRSKKARLNDAITGANVKR